jgi:predicted RNA binding protein YcfA (HicA-like mRNA interferase family)
MTVRSEIHQLLCRAGFRLVRANGHRVYQNAHGVTMRVSSSPSDVNAIHHVERLLRKKLAAGGAR